MVRNIVLFFIFPCLIIAFVLSFAGITQIARGEGFKLWMESVNTTFNSWSFEIPKINKIEYLGTYDTGVNRSITRVATTPVAINVSNLSFKQIFQNFANFFIGLANAFIIVTNIITSILNILIQVLQFVLSMVWCIKDIPTYIRQYDVDTESLWWYQNVGV